MEGGRKGSGLGFSDGSRCVIVSGKCLGNGRKDKLAMRNNIVGLRFFFSNFFKVNLYNFFSFLPFSFFFFFFPFFF
jgi:hypothetical protein